MPSIFRSAAYFARPSTVAGLSSRGTLTPTVRPVAVRGRSGAALLRISREAWSTASTIFT